MAQFSAINAVLIVRRRIFGPRKAIVLLYSQCTAEVKVVSRGTPRSRTLVTWGIWWLAFAAEKDGERRGRFPTVRHKHLLRLIGSVKRIVSL